MNAHLKLLHFRMINKGKNKKIVVAMFILDYIMMPALYANIVSHYIMKFAVYANKISGYIVIFTFYVKIII